MTTSDTLALTHLDEAGRAQMVAVGAKPETHRVAMAQATVVLSDVGFAAVIAGSQKGDALQVARIAGIQAAKRTSDLIPLCHPLRLTHVAVTAEPDAERRIVVLRATVEAVDRTGVEMEALTAVTVAALVLYDMVKSVDHAAVIERVHLVEKRGGKRGLVRPHG